MIPGQSPKLVLGFSEGSVEVRAGHQEDVISRFLEGTFAAPVVELKPGPSGTILVGFGDGHLGLWDTETGVRLASDRAMGEIASILHRDGTAYVITSQGDHLSWDLSVFAQDRCALLREIWAFVPVVWDRGRAVSRPPPADHACQRQ